MIANDDKLITSYRPPVRDELLFSWIEDLADLNFGSAWRDINRTRAILMPYVKPEEGRYRNLNEPVRCDFLPGIDASISYMGTSGRAVPIAEEVVMNQTILGVTGIARTEGAQARYLETALRTPNGSAFDMPKVPDLSGGIVNLCPQCLKEFDFPYTRTWHQIPGVTACAIHGIRLVKVPGDHLRYAYHRKYIEAELATDNEIQYAKYVRSMYLDPPQVDVQTASDAICDALDRKHFRVVEHVRFEDLVRMLMKVFPDWKGFQKAVFFCKKIQNIDHFEELTGTEVKTPEQPISTMQCRGCGFVWTGATAAIRRGFGCPECARRNDPNKVINQALSTCGDGRYRLAEPFAGMGTTQAVTHCICGKTTKIRLSTKLWEGVTCACEKTRSIQSLQKEADELAAGFTILSYETNSMKTTLRHTCGESFTVIWQQFKNYPKCRCCEGIAPTKAGVQRMLDEAAGPGYEIKEYESIGKPMKIRHSCGCERTLRFSEIKAGTRLCLVCMSAKKSERRISSYSYEGELLREMNGWFSAHKVWIAKRHRIGAHGKQYYSALARLVRKGMIIRVSDGCYAAEETVSIYDILRERYLVNDDGAPVGDFTGAARSYLDGAGPEPDVITLETTRLARKSASTVFINTRPVSVIGK